MNREPKLKEIVRSLYPFKSKGWINDEGAGNEPPLLGKFNYF